MTGGAPPPADRERIRTARAHLSRVVEPGDRALGRLAADHGYLGLLDLLRTGDVPDRWVVRSRSLGPSTPEVMMAAGRSGIRVVVPGDPEWPPGIDALADADCGEVPCLWVRGRLPVWTRDDAAPPGRAPGGPTSVEGTGGAAAGEEGDAIPGDAMPGEVTPAAVAVVGSRDCSSYGESIAGSLGAELAAAGWTVVSGAALGVDAAAHRGALANAAGGLVPTVAVLGCGVDRAYPAAHATLLGRIAASGAVVAELPPGSPPYPWRFPARNRVIAAMARGVVVVEADRRSGALGTARAADALSRPVMAVPGPAHSRRSSGCHALIRDGGTLVTGTREVIEVLGPLDAGDGDEGPPGDPRADRVLRCLSRTRDRTVDEVAAATGLDPAQARSVLLDLEVVASAVRGVGGWRRAATAPGQSRGV